MLAGTDLGERQALKAEVAALHLQVDELKTRLKVYVGQSRDKPSPVAGFA